MLESESSALPLGDTPVYPLEDYSPKKRGRYSLKNSLFGQAKSA
jgi:hypothetical protein